MGDIGEIHSIVLNDVSLFVRYINIVVQVEPSSCSRSSFKHSLNPSTPCSQSCSPACTAPAAMPKEARNDREQPLSRKSQMLFGPALTLPINVIAIMNAGVAAMLWVVYHCRMFVCSYAREAEIVESTKPSLYNLEIQKKLRTSSRAWSTGFKAEILARTLS